MTTESRCTELAQATEFFPVPLATLVVGTSLPFDLYSRIQERSILLREAGRSFEEKDRTALAALGDDELFVRCEQQPRYIAYLESQIQRLLHDPGRPMAERVSSCFEVGAAVTRAALTDPETPQNLRMVQEVVGASSGMLRQEGGFAAFFHRMREDADLFVHSLHVCFYGLGLAAAAGLHDDETVRELGLGLLFHDIGKLQLPAALLAQNRPLDDDEWVQVTQHPLEGWARVERLQSFGPIARDVIENHHERLDGSGYPRGLSGRDLSVYARVAGIANTFDSHTTRRPYRAASNSCQVLTRMLKEKHAYDRALLTDFVKLLAGLSLV